MLWIVSAIFALPTISNQHLVSVGTGIKCQSLASLLDAICPPQSNICKCPPGYYGSISRSSNGTWVGDCAECPPGSFTPHAGAATELDCAPVSCPANAAGTPCTCSSGYVGSLSWNPCMGSYDGECNSIQEYVTSPPLQTIILGGPANVSVDAGVTFYFEANVAGSTFQCILDDVTTTCFEPSVKYKQLSQGLHRFTIIARDSFGRVEETPTVIDFEVNVPCPPNSASRGPPSYNCTCIEGYTSVSLMDISYSNGGYESMCVACQPCAPGAVRQGCNTQSPGTCNTCPSGTYKTGSQYYATVCLPCQACPAGMELDSCGLGSPGFCAPCAPGFFKPSYSEWNTSCMSCEPCPAGQYRIECGGSDPGRCVACPPLTYKPSFGAWDTSCTPVVPCDPGYELKNYSATTQPVCSPCRSHYYRSTVSLTEPCIPCEPCSVASGGYRSNCGGAIGPGTCEACNECVGTPPDQCFCENPTLMFHGRNLLASA